MNNLHCEKLRSRLHFLCAKTDISSSVHSQGSATSQTTPSSSISAIDASNMTTSSHGQLKPGTSPIQMQYATTTMQVPPYGMSPQNFQLTTAMTNTIGSEGTHQQR